MWQTNLQGSDPSSLRKPVKTPKIPRFLSAVNRGCGSSGFIRQMDIFRTGVSRKWPNYVLDLVHFGGPRKKSDFDDREAEGGKGAFSLTPAPMSSMLLPSGRSCSQPGPALPSPPRGEMSMDIHDLSRVRSSESILARAQRMRREMEVSEPRISRGQGPPLGSFRCPLRKPLQGASPYRAL